MVFIGSPRSECTPGRLGVQGRLSEGVGMRPRSEGSRGSRSPSPNRQHVEAHHARNMASPGHETRGAIPPIEMLGAVAVAK